MATFAVHVVLSHEFVAVQFAPGDEVPEWALGQVGAHCLAVDVDPVEVSEPDDESDPEPEPVLVVESAAPDFTKPTRRVRK